MRGQLLDVEHRQAVPGERRADGRAATGTRSARGRSCRTGARAIRRSRCGASIVTRAVRRQQHARMPATKSFEVGHVREHVVGDDQVGLPAPRHEAARVVAAEERDLGVDAGGDGGRGDVGGRLDAEHGDAARRRSAAAGSRRCDAISTTSESGPRPSARHDAVDVAPRVLDPASRSTTRSRRSRRRSPRPVCTGGQLHEQAGRRRPGRGADSAAPSARRRRARGSCWRAAVAPEIDERSPSAVRRRPGSGGRSASAHPVSATSADPLKHAAPTADDGCDAAGDDRVPDLRPARLPGARRWPAVSDRRTTTTRSS